MRASCTSPLCAPDWHEALVLSREYIYQRNLIYLLGEAGIVVCVVLVVIAFVFSRGRWTMIRQLPKRGEPAHEEVLPPVLI